jgi:hypothetical protein
MELNSGYKPRGYWVSYVSISVQHYTSKVDSNKFPGTAW